MKRRRIGRGAFNAMLRDMSINGRWHLPDLGPLAVHPTALVLGPNAETGTLDDAGEFVPVGDSGRAPTHARMRKTGTWPHAEAQPPIALLRSL